MELPSPVVVAKAAAAAVVVAAAAVQAAGVEEIVGVESSRPGEEPFAGVVVTAVVPGIQRPEAEEAPSRIRVEVVQRTFAVEADIVAAFPFRTWAIVVAASCTAV